MRWPTFSSTFLHERSERSGPKGITMGIRRAAREEALKILYSLDLSGNDQDESLTELAEREELSEEIREYARRLVLVCREERTTLDTVIARVSEHWTLRRMNFIDRNVLRMAACELLYIEEIPPKVAINEAVDIAQRYGTESSGAFVNGILDRIAKDRAMEIA